MTEIVALVPMRHQSERMPGKNYRVLGDRPLFAHIIDTLLGCRSIGKIFIDTDSPQIRELALPRYGPSINVLDRPGHLRDGKTSMDEVLLDAVDRIEADLYLQTHSTNPFLQGETIDRAIGLFVNDSGHDALFGVTRLRTRLYRQDGSPINHDPSLLIRTQDLPPVYEDNSCLYVFSSDSLRTAGSRLGSNPMMFEVHREEAWDIDDESDFRLAEQIWRVREATQ